MILPVLVANAVLQTQTIMKGTDLYRDCKNWVALVDATRKINGDDLYQAGTCYGYMEGLGAGLLSLGVSCPADATIGTMIRVYLVYMDKNPKVFDYAASAGVVGAMRESYPCPTK